MDSMPRSTEALLVALVTLGLLACSDAVVAPEPGVEPTLFAKGKPGGPPGGGSGGPSAGPVITTFADAPGHGFHSDGLGPYATIKRRGEVSSAISPDGRHAVTVDAGPAGRTLCVTFPAAADAVIASQPDWDELVLLSGGAIDFGSTYCANMGFHTRDHSEPGNLLGMDADPDGPPLDVQTSGGKIPLSALDVDQSWEWRLFFDDGQTAIHGGDEENGVCIRYDPDGAWTVGTDPAIAAGSDDPDACAGVDDLLNLIRVTSDGGGATYTHVATFRMPFEYRITPQ